MALAAALSAAVVIAGCSERPASISASAADGGDGQPSSSSAAPARSARLAGDGSPAVQVDAGLEPEDCPGWPGWEKWDDFSAHCPFCVPKSEEQLPEPIVWEPCPPQAELPPGACRWMKPTWPYGSHAWGFIASIDTSVPGKTYLMLARVSVPGGYEQIVVAEADGPVRFALLDPRPPKAIKGCYRSFAPTHSAVRHGRFVGYIRGDHMNQEYYPAPFVEGIWGGRIGIDLRPKLLAKITESTGHVPVTTDSYWGSWGHGIAMASWGGAPEQVYGAGLQAVQLMPWHDFALWRASGWDYAAVMAWKAGVGAYPFIVPPPDSAAHAMGTDGCAMVWISSTGWNPDTETYATRSIMTAPFTTDPAALEPRRLRSYPSSSYPISPWAVGCGRAAYNPDGHTLMVVRLSDGVSWMRTTPGGGNGNWGWGSVYAINCDEVFLEGTLGQMNIARVKLDALGPEIAPD